MKTEKDFYGSRGGLTKQQQLNIDLGIDVLRRLMKPGQRVGTRTIASVCGVTNSAIFYLEKRALKKVREGMRRKLALSYGALAQHTKDTV